MYKIINRKKLAGTVCADILGNILFFPFRFFQKPEPITPENVKKLCIIRTAYIGDVVMTLPMLPPLRQRFPDATITFLSSTSAAPLLEQNPYIDEILTFNPFWFYSSRLMDWLQFISTMRTRSFDLVLETRGDIRELALIVFPMRAGCKVGYTTGGGAYLLTHTVPYPGLCHKVEYHLNMVKYLGASVNGAEGNIFLGDEEYEQVSLLLKKHGIKTPFITIHPGSRLILKRWFTERFAELGDILSNRYGIPVILLGTQQEKELCNEIQAMAKQPLISMAGKLDLRQLGAVLALAHLFICNDSAPMHIAATMRTPTVAIFGPSKSVETAPYGKGCRVVEKEFPCRYTCDESHCRFRKYHACMKQIGVGDVLHAVEGIMEQSLRYYAHIPKPTNG